jgi:homocysteine S-methyltransferase
VRAAVDGAKLPGTLAERVVLLDGGLATRLEERGHDLADDLWSARLLLDDPGEVTAAHADYFASGADVATTASYQVSYDGLAARGVDRSGTDRLLRRSVELAREAAESYEGPRWVAASIGPYGASLADGQEYTGDYDLSVAGLRAWHRPRLATLIEADPDVLALETLPCLDEVEALLAEVTGTGIPCWLSLTADGELTRRGEPLAEAFAMASDVAEVVAVGVNCCTAESADAGLPLAVAASGKAGVVYPNSGEGWDGARRVWVGSPTFTPDRVTAWVAAGARLVGGCCRVGPPEIERIGALVR